MTVRAPGLQSQQPAGGSERRCWSRLMIRTPNVAFCALEADRPLLVRVTDMSDGGLRVLMPAAYEQRWPALAERVYKLQVNLDGDLLVDAEVKVAWLGGVKRGSEGTVFCGLRFAALSDAASAALSACLERLRHG